MDTATLLSIWELGSSQPPVQRGLGLLATAWPERSIDDWAQQPIGRRDNALLQLRERLFGTGLEGLVACPQCDERVELAFSTTDLHVDNGAAGGADGASDSGTGSDTPIQIEAEGYAVTCRLPNSLDVLVSATLPAPQQRAALLQRCVISAVRSSDDLAIDGVAAEATDVPVIAMPETLVTTLAERLAAADPQAAMELALSCPGCRHQWSVAFDILTYLWGELEDWAQRLLLDIHAIASAYGWSERDILTMSPRRRRMYLDLLGA
jgi:hypothetical protein